MSSNIKVERICEWCGNKFTAQTTVTRFCSKRCAEHSYKERLRQKKVALSDKKVSRSNKSKHRDKDFLTPTETAQFLGVGRTYIYNCINRGKIKVTRIGRKTLINKSDIIALSDYLPLKEETAGATEKKDKTITEFYTRADIREKFGVKDSWIYKVVAENNVPKTMLRGKAYFSKAHIDRLFSARKENPEITEWYSVEDIQAKYGMTLLAIYNPPIWNPNIKKMSRREFLGLYLIGDPKDKFEMDYNDAILTKARGIRAQREMAIINGEFGFIDKTKKHADFLAYFENKAKAKYQKWDIVYKHFCEFTNGRCLVKDITVGLCNDFRSHILSLRVKNKKYAKISANSAAGYWSTFRALLKMAYKGGLLKENINDHLESIDYEEPKINFLEMDEIKRLVATPCKVDVLKRASLFACLTGLRISDILQLKWENIEVSPDGGHGMLICTQKTKT